jgi:hypothetical protein
MKNKYMIRNFEHDSFSIKVNEDFDGKLVIDFEGEALIKEKDDINELGGYLVRLHNEIISANIKTINLSLEFIDIMNSEYFKVLSMWFDMVKELEEQDRYKINLIYNDIGGESGNYIDIIKNMYPKIINLSRPSINVIHHFDFKKEHRINGDDWFSFYPSEGIMFTDKIKEYILKRYSDKLPHKFIDRVKDVFKNLPKTTEIFMEKHRIRISPIQEFFNNVMGSYIRLYPDTDISEFVNLPSFIADDEQLKRIIRNEYHLSKRRALTSLLNNTEVGFKGKLIMDSLNIDLNVNFTEPIITSLTGGMLCISRREPAFNFGNIILFVNAGDWCSIKDSRITNGVISFSPNVVVNCDGLEVKEKLTIITYQKCKSLYINLDKELEKTGKVNFAYLDDEDTKSFLRTNGWPIYPEPNEDEILEAYRIQKEQAENPSIIKYEAKQPQPKKDNPQLDWSYVSIPGETYGKLVKLYKDQNSGIVPDYTKVMKLYDAMLKKYGNIENDDYTGFNDYLDGLMRVG